MRQITKSAVSAFRSNVKFSDANTSVIVDSQNQETVLTLHGSAIAKSNCNGIFISNAGWATNTTKERLNGVLSEYGKGRISQVKGKWLLNGTEFPDNQWVPVA
jgi:hypothetical protein